jgi:hypothetical protein
MKSLQIIWLTLAAMLSLVALVTAAGAEGPSWLCIGRGPAGATGEAGRLTTLVTLSTVKCLRQAVPDIILKIIRLAYGSLSLAMSTSILKLYMTVDSLSYSEQVQLLRPSRFGLSTRRLESSLLLLSHKEIRLKMSPSCQAHQPFSLYNQALARS